MKCEKCVEAGLKSTINAPLGCFVTAMGYYRYYDEEGKYHSHNPNVSTSEYSCSQGHIWIQKERSGCNACGTTGSIDKIYK